MGKGILAGGSGSGTDIPITSTPGENVKIWIDPNEEGAEGGVSIPASDTEPATGNYWLDTSAEGGTFYTAGETLSNETKELLGLGSNATPDDAFAEIIRYLSDIPTASIFVTSLSETDTVTATNSRKTLTGKWTQKPNPASVVPDGYTQLEYIKNSGTQILDTGIAINNDHKIEVKVNSETYNGTWAGFVNSDDSLIRFDNFKFYWGYPSQVISDLFSAGLNVITASKNGIVVNGVTHANSYTLKDNTTSFALFGEKRAKNPVGYSPCSFEIEFYYAKIWDNDSLVRDLIPCKRNSDSVVGMYDLVSGAFFENAGTGEFIKGPEIPQTIDGHMFSPIRELGTWTVTATDGEQTTTRDVMVDVFTEYKIKMDFTKLWLYCDGDECEDMTGGIIQYEYSYDSISPSVAPQKNSDNLQLFCGPNQSCQVRTSNKIDMSGYSKLYVDYMTVETDNTNKEPFICIAEYSNTYIASLTKLFEENNLHSLTRTIAEIDISAISKSAYIFLGTVGNRKAYVYNVWLEK